MTREEFLTKLKERREQRNPQNSSARFREAIERLRARKAAAEAEAKVTEAESSEANPEK